MNPQIIVAAAFKLPHDGDMKVVSMSTGQWVSLTAYKNEYYEKMAYHCGGITDSISAGSG